MSARRCWGIGAPRWTWQWKEALFRLGDLVLLIYGDYSEKCWLSDMISINQKQLLSEKP